MKKTLVHWLAAVLGLPIKINGVSYGARANEEWESYPK